MTARGAERTGLRADGLPVIQAGRIEPPEGWIVEIC